MLSPKFITKKKKKKSKQTQNKTQQKHTNNTKQNTARKIGFQWWNKELRYTINVLSLMEMNLNKTSDFL